MTLSIMTLGIITLHAYAECHYAECLLCSVSQESLLCWVLLCWGSLFWMWWRHILLCGCFGLVLTRHKQTNKQVSKQALIWGMQHLVMFYLPLIIFCFFNLIETYQGNEFSSLGAFLKDNIYHGLICKENLLSLWCSLSQCVSIKLEK